MSTRSDASNDTTQASIRVTDMKASVEDSFGKSDDEIDVEWRTLRWWWDSSV